MYQIENNLNPNQIPNIFGEIIDYPQNYISVTKILQDKNKILFRVSIINKKQAIQNCLDLLRELLTTSNWSHIDCIKYL